VVIKAMKYITPLSIVIAGILIGGSILYKNRYEFIKAKYGYGEVCD
jgi:hypothetical protein